MIKIAHLSATDITGGAARAAFRIHHALLAQGAESRMLVNQATSDDWTVKGPVGRLQKLVNLMRPSFSAALGRTFSPTAPPPFSPALVPSYWAPDLNSSDFEVVNLHWLGGEMMSIADIGRLKKPVVWTLHDMWAFCGAEHYSLDARFREGYRSDNRPANETGWDFNRWVWNRKLKHWRRPMHVITPSHWLADMARQSRVMRDWPIHVVPNAIDTETWRPIDQTLARDLLGLPAEGPLLMFGAIGGSKDPRKGFDLLREALTHLQGRVDGLRILVIGQSAPRESEDLGFPIYYARHLFDDLSLRVCYSAADVVVIPSRQDNLPNAGLEALACGTPVVAFDTGGLPDIVEHERNGYLAKAFDPEQMASGIEWVLSDSHRLHELRLQARRAAEEKFTYANVAGKYLDVYRQALGHH